MKIAFICDMHLPESKNSPQYAFFYRAIAQMRRDNVNVAVNLGDIDSFGEVAPLEDYIREMSGFESYYVFGNSEVRDENTLEKIMTYKTEPRFKVGKRTFLGINTPYADIDESDRQRLLGLEDGDVVLLHHYLTSLHKDSREFFERLLGEKSLTVIHGHAHKWMDYAVGKSRVYGIRALDPDKSIGGYPCITYVDVSDDGITFCEKCFGVEKDTLLDVRKYFGISCVDNGKDVSYAIENGVKNLEIRCRSLKDVDYSVLPLVKKWRETCGEYLSLHMPDIKFENGEFSGVEKWNAALDFAKALGVDGLTIHPPAAKISSMAQREVWDKFLGYYVNAVGFMGGVRVGIENMHMSKGEKNDRSRGFGFTPEEVSSWIDAINEKLDGDLKVGHVLDVGHARNNGIIASTNPVGRWYEKMGNKTVAYHIHQTVMDGGVMKNHCPIANWFGPMISYASFFYAWETGMVNRVPVFLEVKGSENYDISVKAFERILLLSEVEK